MKKTLISLATASLIASSAMAADKGIDLDVSGQAVVYYQTNDTVDFFNKNSSNANAGLQLNIGGNLGNGFTMGSQLTYLGTAGLNRNLVGDTNVMQVGGSVPVTQTLGGSAATDDLALTKIFVAKTIGNTTVKIGRQELPKSLSPLAFSEGWNVFKNTFEAILVVNSDLPDTTVVLAAVGASNSSTNLSTMTNMTAAGLDITGSAYMLTVQNTSLPMTTLTGSYYAMSEIGGANSNNADAVWLDAKIADKSLPMGLKAGIQVGSIMTDLATMPAAEDTSVFGVKVGVNPMPALKVCAAYTSVNDGTVPIKNVGTGIKTPLYTQMVANQNAISLDADTMMLSGAYSLGDAGKIVVRGSSTTAGKSNLNGENDFTDLELLYKVKAGGVNFLAAFLNTEVDGKDAVNTVRVVARYAF